MNIVTHNGPFHADDVLSIAVLREVYDVESVTRTREEAMIAAADIVVDVGAEYDPAAGKFDHHQPEGAGERECGTPYASIGLVWMEYGLQYVESVLERDLPNYPVDLEVKAEVVDLVDDMLIRGIDATDTGNPLSSLPEGVTTISRTISMMNPTFIEQDRFNTDSDEQFMVAVEYATTPLERAVWAAYAQVKARREVEQAERMIDDRVLILERFVPWSDQDCVHEDEDLLYVVFRADTGTWMVQQVPREPGSFEGRKPLPEAWAGLSGEDLQEEAGVRTAVFCHSGRFIAGAETKKDAILLASLAVHN